MRTVVWMNGRSVAADEARVSIFDRGFLYGDSVYEVIRTYQGVPFELPAHLERLAASASRIGMTLPVATATFAEEVAAALEARTAAERPAEGPVESYVRLVVTRGAGAIGLDPALATDPTWLVIAQPLTPPPAELYERGVAVAITDVRRNLRTAIDPQAKTGNYLNSVLAVAEAKARGAYEAIMLDHRGLVAEGSSSNVFAVLGDRLITPPLEVGLLAGITRSVVLRIALQAGLRPLEAPLSADSLLGADEVLITSSIREMLAVTSVDGQPIGPHVPPRPGPAYQRLRAVFAEYVAEHNRRATSGA